jgi:5-formyltetrahydrofolate cyclo-ligase
MVDRVRQLKQQMRVEASARRAKQPAVDRLSRQIFERLAVAPEYVTARTLMLYLDIRSEVRTRWYVPTLWEQGKTVVVPYCENGDIELFRLEQFEDLVPGTMGVLEPQHELRRLEQRRVTAADLDLILIPGLAFDRHGSRLGYGKGYYDRLLHQIRPDATKVGLCFECQLFAEIPVLPHDICVDVVITENGLYRTSTP